MSSERIPLKEVLAPAEYAAIDSFGHDHPGEDSLPALADFLKTTFRLELVLDSDIVKGFATDSSNLPGRAGAVCRPRNERECAIVLRACHAAGIPCTVSAGKSNLTGSATPPGGIILSTVLMTEPAISVDEVARTVRAPVGMILEDLRNQVLAQTGQHLIFPVNPTSRADAAVGGAIACNASGFTPGESGAMRPWVESIDFLLPNALRITATRGQHLSANGVFHLSSPAGDFPLPVPRHPRPAIKNAGGPYSSPDGVLDFLDLVIGSEGLFGVVTACTLRLEPRPADYLDLFFSLPAEANAIDFLDYIRGHLNGNLGQLTALEYFGVNCRRFMDHEERLFHGADQVGIYIQVPLAEGAVETAAEQWLDILMGSNCGVNDDAILLMDNDRDRAMFMQARHSLPANSLEVVQHRGTFTIMTDTVVPPENFRAFLDYTHGLLRAEGLDYLAFGHLGDCHLHFSVMPEKAQLTRCTEVYSMIIARSAELGGVYSGEHGTGKRKRADFLACYGPEAAAAVRNCKAVLDPQFLLNRGNVIE